MLRLRDGRRWALLLLVVGVLQVVLAAMGEVGRARATTSRIPRLHYSAVELVHGYHSRGAIHLMADDGQVYLLSTRSLPDSLPMAEVLRRLRSASIATVTIRGTKPRWLFGYPTVTELTMPGLYLAAGPETLIQRTGLFGLGLGLVVLAVILLLREGGRTRQRRS